MARYLLVAHQTAECDELREAAANLAAEDPEAEFVLLVPATPVNSLLVWERGETYEVAVKRAASASERLRQDGLRVVDARPGDADPLAAVADEIDAGGQYRAIVVSTLPAGVSRWLKMDVPSRLNRNFPRHRVIHVIARPGVATAKA
jgi:hypothetical protein